jgi:hypothetical protein
MSLRPCRFPALLPILMLEPKQSVSLEPPSSSRVARGYELKITLVDPIHPTKEGARHSFDNLKKEVSVPLLPASVESKYIGWRG